LKSKIIVMPKKFLQIHPQDNVLVALTDLIKGETILHNNVSFSLATDVRAKHKFPITPLAKGDEVKMYGVLIGRCTQAIRQGELIHTHNMVHASNEDYKKSKTVSWTPPNVEGWKSRTFNGYHRSDGRVGTANYWLFIPMVFCENRNLELIKEALTTQLGYGTTHKYKRFTASIIEQIKLGSDLNSISFSPILDEAGFVNTERIFPNVDGVKFIMHEGGCGSSHNDSEVLGRLLAAYADHPNVGGVTVLSLGCQHLQVNQFKEYLRKRNPSFDKPLYIFDHQEKGTEENLLGEAIKQTFIGLQEINKTERKPAPLSKLCIGVKCGGSDGFSGISANPAVGHTSDLLSALGGSVLLAEFPELFGAEQELVDRCVTEELADKFTHLMKTYNEKAKAVGSGMQMNPSPGNIRDGLITDAMKSAGAAKKGGTSPINDVLNYTEKATKPGLSLVCTPGSDVEATTGKVASGATLILFTTGLGTPTGNVVCPTIKISTNTALKNRMPDIIDIDTGAIITGEKTIEQSGEEILEYCIKSASGEIIPKAVQLGQDDFIPWKRGVSL
jgi:altronate hydrolase